jgi:hypothetical protein
MARKKKCYDCGEEATSEFEDVYFCSRHLAKVKQEEKDQELRVKFYNNGYDEL